MAEELLYLPKVLFNKRTGARAAIRGNEAHPDITGEMMLYPFQGGTLVVTAVRGLPENNFYALHIHDGSECVGDFTTAGAHFNPTGAEHPNHAGDLPPLLSSNHFAYMILYTGRFTPEEVTGKTVIIHEKPDDFKTQPSGGAGARIACGIIEN